LKGEGEGEEGASDAYGGGKEGKGKKGSQHLGSAGSEGIFSIREKRGGKIFNILIMSQPRKGDSIINGRGKKEVVTPSLGQISGHAPDNRGREKRSLVLLRQEKEKRRLWNKWTGTYFIGRFFRKKGEEKGGKRPDSHTSGTDQAKKLTRGGREGRKLSSCFAPGKRREKGSGASEQKKLVQKLQASCASVEKRRKKKETGFDVVRRGGEEKKKAEPPLLGQNRGQMSQDVAGDLVEKEKKKKKGESSEPALRGKRRKKKLPG